MKAQEKISQNIKVSPEEAQQRLDLFLTCHLPDLTRSRLQSLIKTKQVTVTGVNIIQPSHRVNAGDEIHISIPEPVTAWPHAEKIPLDVIYEDHDVIVINKPAGMVTHPAPGNLSGTLVNALMAHCHETLSGIGGQLRPGIVHRLDKDTSGLLVAAKNDLSHQGLSKQFAAHGRDGKLIRSYEALAWNVPKRKCHKVDAPLGRARTNRTRQSVLKNGGRNAITHYQVMETFSAHKSDTRIAARLDCRLETGRTHQIRVHMAYSGHPLLGDPLYAKGYETKAEQLSDGARAALQDMNRQALHAGYLSFLHPRYEKRIELKQEIPDDFRLLLDAMRQHR
ncbi:MAG: RluA family pseudouridine synthase [Alphaproteobacteria bacterium]|nr:RluA family pseudouridine synthase [Alphaproteobacteria bacterium]